MVIVQIIAAYAVSSLSWPLVILAAYVFGGTINHSMALAIHEISHNLAVVAVGHPSRLRFWRNHQSFHGA